MLKSNWSNLISVRPRSWYCVGLDKIFQYTPEAILTLIFKAFGMPESQIDAWIS